RDWEDWLLRFHRRRVRGAWPMKVSSPPGGTRSGHSYRAVLFRRAMPSKEHVTSEDRVDRCVTGVEGVDNILNGGIPRGNTVLLTGAVGGGQTSLCLEFLVHGALHGENSLYISVPES